MKTLFFNRALFSLFSVLTVLQSRSISVAIQCDQSQSNRLQRQLIFFSNIFTNIEKKKKITNV